jgi:hypothetical protein
MKIWVLGGVAALAGLAGLASAQVVHVRAGDFQGDVGDQLGAAVSGAGDVDGDGVADYIVGAPNYTADIVGDLVVVGRIAVLSGRTGAVLFDPTGPSVGSAFGASVAAAGDVNNDGFADVVIGAPFDGSGPTVGGSVTVLAGPDGVELYKFFGGTFGDQLGVDVAGAGDVNNDGFADIVAGSTNSDVNASNAGLVRVYSGADGSVLHSFFGGAVNDRLGRSVAGVGDIDNDGFDDVAAAFLGDVNASNAGAVRIYSGATGAILRQIDGDAANDALGSALASAGDLNNDGAPDILIGAWQADTNGVDAGVVKVFSGSSGAVLRTISGGAPGQALGFSVDALGDINGDGVRDIIVGVPGDAALATNAGSLRVYSGASGQLLAQARSSIAGAQLGFAVASAGDINADGVSDLIAGAPFDNRNGQEAGAISIYTSGESISVPPPAPVCSGDADGNRAVNFSDITTVLANFGIACP